MISETMQSAISEQINREIYSAYVYLAMSDWTSSEGLKGMSRWFHTQYEEELGHAMRLFNYLLDRNARVGLKAIKEPPASYDSPLAAFEAALHHEQEVTRSIGHLMDLAIKEKDHASHNMLEWFVNEQVEEEANVQQVIDQIRIIGKEGSGLYLLDIELGKRSALDEESGD